MIAQRHLAAGEGLIRNVGAAIALHRRVVRGDHLGNEHTLDRIERRGTTHSFKSGRLLQFDHPRIGRTSAVVLIGVE